MTLAKVFGAFGELRPTDRFEIGCLFGVSHQFVPVTAADFAGLTLPTSPDAAAMFIEKLRVALGYVLDGELAKWSVRDLVPGIVGLADAVETAPSASNRLLSVVRSRGHRTWGELAGYTVSEIRSWHGTGRQMTISLIVGAAEVALRNAQLEADHQLSLSFTTEVHRSAVCLSLEACLASMPDIRSRVMFEIAELRLVDAHHHDAPYDGSTPRDRLQPQGRAAARQFIGGTKTRGHTLISAAHRHVNDSLDGDAAVKECVRTLAGLLGEAVDTEGMHTALSSLGLPGFDTPATGLAIWLAGPYLPIPGHPQWWSPRPGELTRSTQQLLAESGGVHRTDAVLKDLAALGVTSANAERWLARQDVHIDHQVVVSLVGRLSQVLVRMLEATGRALSASELTEWMHAHHPVSAVVASLRKSAVFVETAPDRWELTEWGGQPVSLVTRVQVIVTGDVMAGDTAEAPIELATSLALTPGLERKLPTKFGPFIVSYDGVRVVRGSVRPVALASGARVGDVLVFVIDPQQSAVEVTVEADPSTRLFDPVQPPVQPPIPARPPRSPARTPRRST